MSPELADGIVLMLVVGATAGFVRLLVDIWSVVRWLACRYIFKGEVAAWRVRSGPHR
jgi:hypothetical protein